MKIKLLFFIITLGLGNWSKSQVDSGYELEQFQIFVIPQPQINVKLSFNSNYMRNDPRAFSVTPDRETIDMMAVFQENNALESKEYTPHIVAHFEKKRQQGQQNTLARPASLNVQNQQFNNSNFAWQQMRRQSYFNQLYRPIYRY